MLPQSYEELYRSLGHIVDYNVKRLFGEENPEVVQEVWVKLLEHRLLEKLLRGHYASKPDVFRSHFTLATFRLAANCARTLHRQRRKRAQLEENLQSPALPEGEDPQYEACAGVVDRLSAVLGKMKSTMGEKVAEEAEVLIKNGWDLREVCLTLGVQFPRPKPSRAVLPPRLDETTDYKVPVLGIDTYKPTQESRALKVILSGEEAARHLEMSFSAFQEALANGTIALKRVRGRYQPPTGGYRLSDVERVWETLTGAAA